MSRSILFTPPARPARHVQRSALRPDTGMSRRPGAAAVDGLVGQAGLIGQASSAFSPAALRLPWERLLSLLDGALADC